MKKRDRNIVNILRKKRPDMSISGESLKWMEILLKDIYDSDCNDILNMLDNIGCTWLCKYAREEIHKNKDKMSEKDALLEYLTAEIIELSVYRCRDHNLRRIVPQHIFIAILNDEELREVFHVPKWFKLPNLKLDTLEYYGPSARPKIIDIKNEIHTSMTKITEKTIRYLLMEASNIYCPEDKLREKYKSMNIVYEISFGKTKPITKLHQHLTRIINENISKDCGQLTITELHRIIESMKDNVFDFLYM